MKYLPPAPAGFTRMHWELLCAVEDVIYDVTEQLRRPRPRKRLRPPRRGTGRTLRPGAKTPLWNVLVKRVVPYLRKRGSKVQLARFLGLPKQRLQDCLKTRCAALDAERTLRLLCWIEARQRGKNLSIEIGPRVT